MSARLSFAEETGSEIVEFGLVLLPSLAFVFLIIDIAWMCFAQESLQHAVQVGIRAAVTSYTPGTGGQDAYIKSVVQENAMGFLAGDAGLNKITINYYAPSNLTTPLPNVTGSNAGGNVVEIVVKGVPVNSLGPLMREDFATFSLGATSSDVMESSPYGIPPKR